MRRQIYSLLHLTALLPARCLIFHLTGLRRIVVVVPTELRAGDQNRTGDLLITSQLLYQLSYASRKKVPSIEQHRQRRVTTRATSIAVCQLYNREPLRKKEISSFSSSAMDDERDPILERRVQVVGTKQFS
jgi:hypothetical protein